MQAYLNRSRRSRIISFETGHDYIKLHFQNGRLRVFNEKAYGVKAIADMKRLATEGRGLYTYILKNITDKPC